MSPQSLTRTVTIAANEPGTNVLSGLLVGQIPLTSAAQVTLGITAAAVGLTATFNVGDRVALSMADISAANRMPELDKDVVAMNVLAAPGSIIQLIVANTTAAPIIFFLNIQESPVSVMVG